VPNGEFVGQIPIPVPDVPGVPEEATSFGALFETIGEFFGGLFGGGKSPAESAAQRAFDVEVAATNAAQLINLAQGAPLTPELEVQLLLQFGTSEAVTQAILAARDVEARSRRESDAIVPIPLPEQGGPALVTERFRNLPPLPMVPDVVQGPVGFEGIETMPVDAPLLSSLLPAIRGAAPTIQGLIGGFTGGLLQEVFRPTGELGLGQIPMRQPVPQVAGCPTEKPHTRILRSIKQQTGVSINLSRAKSLIRELGLENAARCLGIGAGEVCSLLIVASPRRRRGISASDIRIVKRTARRFETLKHDLGHMGGRPGHHHHRRRTRHK